MQITTTLKSLRAADACIDGYNRLVRTLQGKPFSEDDAERESYIRYAHKDQIPLSVILQSNDLDDALWALRACDQAPELVRAERLFGVWCARRVQHLMADPRSVETLDVAERHANGNASDDELAAALAAAARAARGAALAAAARAARGAAWDAAWDAARAAARAARGAAWDAARAAARAAAWDAAWDAARAAQKEMFAAVFCGAELNVEEIYAETAAA